MIESNTIKPTCANNGIAVTSGEDNNISQNLIQNTPTNAIGNYSSFGNIYHDINHSTL